MNKEAKVLLDLPLSIEQFKEELNVILTLQSIYYENRVLKSLGKKTRKVPYPERYGNITGKYDIDIQNSKNSKSIILTGGSGEKSRIEIELNSPLFYSIDKDLKYLNEKLQKISREIYIIHTDIINLYIYALDKTVEGELDKVHKMDLTIESFVKKRREIPQLDQLLNKREYKDEHDGLNNKFKQYHGEYVSVFSNIQYLEGLKKKYINELTRRLEACTTIDYYLSQKLRIIYDELCNTIDSLYSSDKSSSVDEEELVDLNFREYSLKLDKKNGNIYASRKDEEGNDIGIDLLGKIDNYNIKQINRSERNVRRVSPFLVQKLLLKYLFLKRMLGYHISDKREEGLTSGDLVKFIHETEEYVGLVQNVSGENVRIQSLNENINLMDDSTSLEIYNINKDDVHRILSIREEIVYITKMKNEECTYNYELYMNFCNSAGNYPEIPISRSVDPVLLKNNLYPSLTIKTQTKKLSKNIGKVLKELIPDMDRSLNEPLTNAINLPTLSGLIHIKNKNISDLIGNLLDADALTTSHIENVEFVSNILDTLKRRETDVEKEEDDGLLMLGGALDDITIFNDFKNLDKSNYSVSDIESISINNENMSGGDDSNIKEINNIDDVSSIEDTRQYGGMDVKNIIITEKI